LGKTDSHHQFYRVTFSCDKVAVCSVQLRMLHTASLSQKQMKQTWLLMTLMMIFLQVV